MEVVFQVDGHQNRRESRKFFPNRRPFQNAIFPTRTLGANGSWMTAGHFVAPQFFVTSSYESEGVR